ncbi:lysylphosphatidylglycerol synthase domain-containing protein [Kineococcus esterisolvens]|uniref:lysylphosphatidylglycerol synthase domain-containing protein n=1 Tax=unclassified Kineococcus TaxID=2621656 RepID=UPI003D7DE31E
MAVEQSAPTAGAGSSRGVRAAPALPVGRFAAGLAATAAAALAVALLPSLLGTTWGDVRAVVTELHPAQLTGLLLVWVLGLLSCSWVLTGSLPGLSRRRALLLNLSGSAVSGALPAGGAVGVWLNTAMLRGWSFRGRDIASFTVTSNVVDVAGKLAFCVPALVLSLALGGVPQLPGAGAWAAALSAAGAAGAALAVLAITAPGARALAGAAAALSRARRGRPARAAGAATSSDDWRERIDGVRAAVAGRLRTAWPQLSVAVLVYVALQALLLVLCLRAGGVRLPLVTVLAAFALDRLASTLALTPSGAGVAEAAACAVLVGAGAPAGPVLAGVLLYRLLLVVLEVPVGALVLGGWLLTRRPGSAVSARGPR